jgi:hypothetical protein
VTASGANLAGGTATNSVSTSLDTSAKKVQLFWLDKK